MLVDNKHMCSIWVEENPHKNHSIKIIDQTQLPHHLIIKELNTTQDAVLAIKNMEVRGAPLIGVTAAFAMYLASIENLQKDFLLTQADLLKKSRPTAVNLAWAVDSQLALIEEALDVVDLPNLLLNNAKDIALQDVQNCKTIGKIGYDILKAIAPGSSCGTINVLTHCNAGWLACVDWGTATAPIYYAFEQEMPIHVWVDETRPRNQGAFLTAWELEKEGIPHKVIADNTGGHLMQNNMVDAVIVGSDRITASGDVANKIGTYLKALAAFDNRIPFYVAAPSSTIDWTIHDGLEEVPIETRSEKEVTHIQGWSDNKLTEVRLTPKNSKAANYGFDITPARLITGIITERGVCKASREGLLELYPEKK